MYNDSAGNDEFAAKFTRIVNSQREAEQGNRGPAFLDQYKLIWRFPDDGDDEDKPTFLGGKGGR